MDKMSERIHEGIVRVRSYELDSLGHVNHSVYLNYLEQIRYDALEAGGFPAEVMVAHGWAVHIVRAEVDYRKECRHGDLLRIRTWVEAFRHSSMTVRHEILRDSHDTPGILAVSARIVLVWIGPEGRPIRIPEEARKALWEVAGGDSPAGATGR